MELNRKERRRLAAEAAKAAEAEEAAAEAKAAEAKAAADAKAAAEAKAAADAKAAAEAKAAADAKAAAPAPEAPAPEARTAASKPAIAGPECTSRIVMELNRKERRKLAAEAAKAQRRRRRSGGGGRQGRQGRSAGARGAGARGARCCEQARDRRAGVHNRGDRDQDPPAQHGHGMRHARRGLRRRRGPAGLGRGAPPARARRGVGRRARRRGERGDAAGLAPRRRASSRRGRRGREVWSRRNAAALAAFPALEAASGVPFFTNSGALVLGPEAAAPAPALGAGAALERLGDAASRYPFLAPREGCGAACVDGAAGWIDPDAMIRALLAAASRAHPGKLEVLAGVAVEVSQTWEGVRVATDAGEDVLADRCVICAGAHTRTLAGGLDGVVVSRRTVALLEVSEATAAELSRSMPTIKYCFELASADGGGADEQSRVEAASVYVLPPVRYEDLGGGWFVKIGGGPNDPMAEDPGSEAIDAWLATEGDAATADWLAGVGRELLAGVAFVGDGHRSKACVTTIGGTDVRVAFAVPRRRVAAVSLCCGKAAPATPSARDRRRRCRERLEDAGV
ncbi:FAD dependent oxidoreductase [Aureococcus anophagefferens]|nr:FAD dependent oxidoreductase [Aureococcus anophagefferens]